MLNRILISLVLIPVVLFTVYLGYVPFLVLMTGICLLSAFEFWEMVSKMGFVPRRLPGNIFIVLVLLSVFFNNSNIAAASSNDITGMLMAAAALALFIYEVIKFDIATAVPSLAVTYLGIIYLGWLPGHFLLLRDIRPDGFKFTILLMVMVWVMDSAAYFFGTAYGSHKLSPVSPKKSIEGSIASVAASVAVMFIAKEFFITCLRPNDVFLLGVLTSVSAQFGDLAESLIKRSAAVKDSSALLKDHGGVLDKLDSFIFAAPVFYYYIRFFILK